jgi:glutamate dehydrogenase (NADP+)
VVSGSGNVAQYAAEKALEFKAKILTMSDSGGYIYDEAGIDSEKLQFIMDLKNVRRGRISEYVDQYPSAKYYEGETPWSVKCDVALPCATQNELQKADAEKLIENGCMCVGEGANMPCTPDAVEVFKEARILFSPGKASNAGGVATSGLEMSQNSMRYNWTSQEVDQKLHAIMNDIHDRCVEFGKEEDGYIDYVKGANIAGFVKVADAMLAQGVV